MPWHQPLRSSYAEPVRQLWTLHGDLRPVSVTWVAHRTYSKKYQNRVTSKMGGSPSQIILQYLVKMLIDFILNLDENSVRFILSQSTSFISQYTKWTYIVMYPVLKYLFRGKIYILFILCILKKMSFTVSTSMTLDLMQMCVVVFSVVQYYGICRIYEFLLVGCLIQNILSLLLFIQVGKSSIILSLTQPSIYTM